MKPWKPRRPSPPANPARGAMSIFGPRTACAPATGLRCSGTTARSRKRHGTSEPSALLEPAGLRYEVGPAGQRIQDAYKVCGEEEPEALPGFHSVSGALRRTLLGKPDVWYRPRAAKRGLVVTVPGAAKPASCTEASEYSHRSIDWIVDGSGVLVADKCKSLIFGNRKLHQTVWKGAGDRSSQ